MHKNNFYISFGIWLLILPFFGIPSSWKNLLVSFSGLFLIAIFVGPAILKKLQPKPKIKKPLDEELKFSNPGNNQSTGTENR